MENDSTDSLDQVSNTTEKKLINNRLSVTEEGLKSFLTDIKLERLKRLKMKRHKEKMKRLREAAEGEDSSTSSKKNIIGSLVQTHGTRMSSARSKLLFQGSKDKIDRFFTPGLEAKRRTTSYLDSPFMAASKRRTFVGSRFGLMGRTAQNSPNLSLYGDKFSSQSNKKADDLHGNRLTASGVHQSGHLRRKDFGGKKTSLFVNLLKSKKQRKEARNFLAKNLSRLIHASTELREAIEANKKKKHKNKEELAKILEVFKEKDYSKLNMEKSGTDLTAGFMGALKAKRQLFMIKRKENLKKFHEKRTEQYEDNMKLLKRKASMNIKNRSELSKLAK